MRDASNLWDKWNCAKVFLSHIAQKYNVILPLSDLYNCKSEDLGLKFFRVICSIFEVESESETLLRAVKECMEYDVNWLQFFLTYYYFV